MIFIWSFYDWEYEDEPKLAVKNPNDPAAVVDMLHEFLGVVEEASQNHHLLPGTADVSDDSMNADKNDVDSLPVNLLPPKRGPGDCRCAICGNHGRPQNNINIDNLDSDNNTDRQINENWVWEKIPEVDHNYEAVVPIFTEQEVYRVSLKDNADALDFVELHMSQNILIKRREWNRPVRQGLLEECKTKRNPNEIILEVLLFGKTFWKLFVSHFVFHFIFTAT